MSDGLEQKYVVYKSSGNYHDPEALDPTEYFVIRSQDVFGPAALYGYAHVIQSNLELSRLAGRENALSDDERTRLQDLADTLVDIATKWLTEPKKVPD